MVFTCDKIGNSKEERIKYKMFGCQLTGDLCVGFTTSGRVANGYLEDVIDERLMKSCPRYAAEKEILGNMYQEMVIEVKKLERRLDEIDRLKNECIHVEWGEIGKPNEKIGCNLGQKRTCVADNSFLSLKDCGDYWIKQYKKRIMKRCPSAQYEDYESEIKKTKKELEQLKKQIKEIMAEES